jgi:hypothetical protein
MRFRNHNGSTCELVPRVCVLRCVPCASGRRGAPAEDSKPAPFPDRQALRAALYHAHTRAERHTTQRDTVLSTRTAPHPAAAARQPPRTAPQPK